MEIGSIGFIFEFRFSGSQLIVKENDEGMIERIFVTDDGNGISLQSFEIDDPYRLREAFWTCKNFLDGRMFHGHDLEASSFKIIGVNFDQVAGVNCEDSGISSFGRFWRRKL